MLAPLATEQPTLVICEGVTMYLERPQLDELAHALQAAFPNHWFCADLMSRAFGRTFTRDMSRVLASIGTAFASLEPDPLAYFISRNYRLEADVPLFPAAVARRRIPLPAPVGLLLSALPVVAAAVLAVVEPAAVAHQRLGRESPRERICGCPKSGTEPRLCRGELDGLVALSAKRCQSSGSGRIAARCQLSSRYSL